MSTGIWNTVDFHKNNDLGSLDNKLTALLTLH